MAKKNKAANKKRRRVVTTEGSCCHGSDAAPERVSAVDIPCSATSGGVLKNPPPERTVVKILEFDSSDNDVLLLNENKGRPLNENNDTGISCGDDLSVSQFSTPRLVVVDHSSAPLQHSSTDVVGPTTAVVPPEPEDTSFSTPIKPTTVCSPAPIKKVETGRRGPSPLRPRPRPPFASPTTLVNQCRPPIPKLPDLVSLLKAPAEQLNTCRAGGSSSSLFRTRDDEEREREEERDDGRSSIAAGPAFSHRGPGAAGCRWQRMDEGGWGTSSTKTAGDTEKPRIGWGHQIGGRVLPIALSSSTSSRMSE